VWHEGHGAVFAVCEDFVWYLVDEEIEAYKASKLARRSPTRTQRPVRTYNQALHLVFPYDFYIQRLLYLVVVLERTTSSRHDT